MGTALEITAAVLATVALRVGTAGTALALGVAAAVLLLAGKTLLIARLWFRA